MYILWSLDLKGKALFRLSMDPGQVKRLVHHMIGLGLETIENDAARSLKPADHDRSCSIKFGLPCGLLGQLLASFNCSTIINYIFEGL